MKEVTIIGKMSVDGNVSDGQRVKTRILTDELVRVFGSDQVACLETIGWKKHPISLLAQSVTAVWKSKNVIFMTDENGTKVFPSLLRMANIAAKCKLHYYVIGGWLSRYLDRSAWATKNLQKLDAIYVELPAMFEELKSRGFRNGVLVNKFRRLNPIDKNVLDTVPSVPYRLCFFSRVMKEKGVEEAITAVKKANEQAGFVKYTLDIFGFIHVEYRQQFEKLVAEFPDYIKYGGIVDFQRSSEVLKDYFAMLFPTFYTSEGYPNTVVDAFAAALPIIATRWQYNADIIHDREDGMLVDVGSVDQIVSALEELAGNPQLHAQLRANALARCSEYLPENAIRKVLENMR